MSGRKLGKGLDALISVGVEDVDKVKSDEVKSDKEISEPVTTDQLSLSRDVISRAIEDGKRNPRVVVWSPKSSVVLRILKKSIPEFSISKEASLLLEEAIKQKYPEIWDKVGKYID